MNSKQWKEDFDNYFLENLGKDDGYTEERRIAKNFIESLLEEQKKELSNRKIYQCGYDDAKKELIEQIKEEMEDVWNNDADRKGVWWKGFSFALDSVTVLLNKFKTHD